MKSISDKNKAKYFNGILTGFQDKHQTVHLL